VNAFEVHKCTTNSTTAVAARHKCETSPERNRAATARRWPWTCWLTKVSWRPPVARTLSPQRRDSSRRRAGRDQSRPSTQECVRHDASSTEWPWACRPTNPRSWYRSLAVAAQLRL